VRITAKYLGRVLIEALVAGLGMAVIMSAMLVIVFGLISRAHHVYF
jgi:hypothetical protein